MVVELTTSTSIVDTSFPVLNELAHLHIRFLQIIRDHKMWNSFSFFGNKIPKMNNTDENDCTSLVEESILQVS